VTRYGSVLLVLLFAGCAGSRMEKLLTYTLNRFALEQELLDAIEAEKAVDVARQLLRDGRKEILITGCLAAKRLKDPSLIPELIRLLDHRDFYVSIRAAHALTKIGKSSIKAVMEECKRLLDKQKRTDTEDWALYHCFSIFRNLKAKETIPLCIHALKEKSKKVRYAALGTIMDTEAKETLPQILSILRNEKDYALLRLRCTQILAKWQVATTEAVEVLIDALDDEAEEVRWGAAMAFKRIKTPKAIPALIEAVTDTSQKVCLEVIRALYYQTGERLSSEYLSSAEKKEKAQKKWLNWWSANEPRFKETAPK